MLKKKIQTFLKSFSFGRWIYNPIKKVYQLYSIPHKRALLQKKGPETMQHLAEIFRRRGIPGCAIYGTLLGFIRQGGFISHDDDIDIAIFPGDWTPEKLLHTLCLEEQGFSFIHALQYHDKIREFSLRYRELPIDFFFFENDAKGSIAFAFMWKADIQYPAINANTAVIVHESKVAGIREIDLWGAKIPVPENAEQLTADHYGPDWRIPNSKWCGERDHKGLEWCTDFGYSMTQEEVLNHKVPQK